MDPRLVALARGQSGLVSAEQAEAFGLADASRRRLTATGRWMRVATNVFDTGQVDPRLHPFDTARLRAPRLGLLSVRGSAAVGLGALAMLGAQGLPRRIPPEVALPRARHGRHRDGIRVRQYDFGMHTRVVGSRRVAAPEWALAQALPDLDRLQAVAVMDSVLHGGLLDAGGLARAHDHARGRPGIATRHGWFDLADGRAESPPESHARLLADDAGLAPDDLQRDLFDDAGTFLGRGDLLWHLGDGRWLVVEVDGAEFHSGDQALRRDTIRQNGLIASGATILRFYPDDLRHPGPYLARLRPVLTLSLIHI
ncbi:type IV toxin-antitoxin system AbiEi family antitoxin domain-containing protein, partial [Myceligenerans indicum]